MDETSDEDLTALLDGQLGESERTEVIRRVAAEPRLQDRLHALARARGPLDAAFAAMLADAPVARLRAALPTQLQRPRIVAYGRTRLAASFVAAAILIATLAAWLTYRVENAKDDW